MTPYGIPAAMREGLSPVALATLERVLTDSHGYRAAWDKVRGQTLHVGLGFA